MEKIKIVAVYGSPRRKGNTATLLKKAVEGARDGGAEVEEIVLRDLKMSRALFGVWEPSRVGLENLGGDPHSRGQFFLTGRQ